MNAVSHPRTFVFGPNNNGVVEIAGPEIVRQAREVSRKRWLNLGFAALLFLFIWMAYQPSLGHTPRSDQWCFLLDTLDQTTFLGTFGHSYSYNRTRAVAPGDYNLFRPGLFALLSAEKAYFGNNFAAWQWVGIGLHYLAVLLGLHIMLASKRLLGPAPAGPAHQECWFTERFFLGLLPYGLALFFAMNFAIVEMVIYSHINGYLLFLVLVLGAISLLLRYWATASASAFKSAMLLVPCWLLLFLAVFTHEIGQAFAVVVGFVLGMIERGRGRLRRGLAFGACFASLFVIYQTANLLDQKGHPGTQTDVKLSTILKAMPTAQSFEHAGRYVLFTAVQPFFPGSATWSFHERLDIPEPRRNPGYFYRGGPLLIASYLLVGAGLMLTVRGLIHLWRGQGRVGRLLFLLLPISLFGLHLGLTVFGRMNLRHWGSILSGDSYYTYLPLLALLIGLYLIWNCVPAVPGQKRYPALTGIYSVVFATLAILTAYSGEKVYAINMGVRKDLKPLRMTAQWLNAFIEEHQDEADFSFAFDKESYDDVETMHGIPVPVILYKPYLNSEHPKYLVALRWDRNHAELAAEARRESGQVFPELVKVGTPYNFYRYQGEYYGVMSWDGYYRPDRDEYLYLIKDKTLEGATGQVPAQTRQQGIDKKLHKRVIRRSPPEPILRGYKGYDFFLVNSRIVGVPQGEDGVIDPRRLLCNEYGRWYCGNSVEDVKNQIRTTIATDQLEEKKHLTSAEEDP
jgi:hypothetical protein